MSTGFKESLKKMIEDRKASMRAVSLKAGLEESYVRKVMNGDIKSPGLDTIERLAKALQCKPTELLPSDWKKGLTEGSELDNNLLTECVRHVITQNKKLHTNLSVEQIAKLSSLNYELALIRGHKVNKDNVISMLEAAKALKGSA